MIGAVAFAAIGSTMVGAQSLSTESRFERVRPLNLPSIRIHESLAKYGVAQSTARRMGLQGRVLWIDATANLGRVNSDEKIEALFDTIQDVGFNTVVFDVKPINGYTMYPSKLTEQITFWRTSTMPKGYDPLAKMVTEAKKHGLSLLVALNAFSEGHSFGKRDFGKADNQFFKPGWGYENPDLQTVRYIPLPTLAGLDVHPALDPKSFSEPVAIFTNPALAPEDGFFLLVDRNRLVTYAGSTKPAELNGNALYAGQGDGARVLSGFGVGSRLIVDSRPTYVPIGDAQNQVPLMMNPHREENQQRALAFVREIMSGYDVDGLLYDDRLRYGGLDSDFSEHTRGLFEKEIGRKVRWPDEVYSTIYSPSLTPGVKPGPLYDAWLTFRSREMQRFMGRVRAEVERNRPGALLGIYAGSWYGDYQRYGTNYGSQDINAGYPFLTRSYRETGFANQLDLLITGCYYPFGTVEEAIVGGGVPGRTVEAGGILTNRVARSQSWSYAGIMISDFWPDPQKIESALQAATATTQGVMVFDLSHNIDQFWPVFKRAFAEKRQAPHTVKGLLHEVRATKTDQDRRGFKEPPFPTFEGAPGTGF